MYHFSSKADLKPPEKISPEADEGRILTGSLSPKHSLERAGLEGSRFNFQRTWLCELVKVAPCQGFPRHTEPARLNPGLESACSGLVHVLPGIQVNNQKLE